MMTNDASKGVRFLLTFGFAVLLAACGGGGGGSSPTASQGVFLDSPVEGLRFETATQSGTTDVNGTFRFMSGEVVTFYVGDILLGSVAGAAVLTPIDLVPGATDETNVYVTNMLRFLQSLDDDGNAANGILISPATRTAIMGQAMSFAQTAIDFEANFNAMSSSMLGSVALVSAAAAQAHMRATLDGMTGGGSGGLGAADVAGVDAPTIGSRFIPSTVTPLFSETGDSVAWMSGNTNAGNANQVVGLNISTINGQLFLLQYDLHDSRSSPLKSYSYNISCWPVAATDCSKINFDISGKRLVLNNVVLVNRESVVIENQATAPITLNGTLYWE